MTKREIASRSWALTLITVPRGWLRDGLLFALGLALPVVPVLAWFAGGAGIGALALDEPLPPRMLLGAGLVIGGVALANRRY